MWVQAILSHDDLADLLAQLTPLTIEVGGPDQFIVLYDVKDVALVPDEGLRLTCKAKIRWPVLGLAFPVNLNALTALLRPKVAKRENGDVLTFGVVLENADFAGLPSIVDRGIKDKINSEIAARGIEGAWDFTEMLTQTVPLPSALRPLESLRMAVAWGKVKITDEALVMAISFHPTVHRSDRNSAPVLPPKKPDAIVPVTNGTHDAALAAHPGLTQRDLVLLGAMGLALVAFAYGAARMGRPKPRPWWDFSL